MPKVSRKRSNASRIKEEISPSHTNQSKRSLLESDFLLNSAQSKTPSSTRRKREKLSILDYSPNVAATRLLSCGEGEQIGHPNRNVTRKPRAVDTFAKGVKFVQAVAGGVHSVVLTDNGTIYSCGINEKGTVPVKNLEAEASTKYFTEIVFSPAIAKLGKPVQIAAGASFAAALTEKGSVIAWGNLRDTQGEVTVHETLSEIQKAPVVIIRHTSKVIVKIVAGENHLVMLSNEGEVLTFGEGSVGQLGRSSRTEHIRSKYMVDETGRSLKLSVLDHYRLLKFTDVFACGFWTMAKAEDGRLFACGLNNFGQLGIKSDNALTVMKNAEDGMETGANGVGEDEGKKVTLLTHTDAFLKEKNWTHIAGNHHIVCRNDEGEIWAIGKNTDNALGLGTWKGNSDDLHWRYDSLQQVILPDNEKALGVSASLGTSIVWTENGKAFAFGFDTVGQLGLGLKEEDEKIVEKPRLISSAHLDGFRVLSASIADNHSLFLAVEDDGQNSSVNTEIMESTKSVTNIETKKLNKVKNQKTLNNKPIVKELVKEKESLSTTAEKKKNNKAAYSDETEQMSTDAKIVDECKEKPVVNSRTTEKSVIVKNNLFPLKNSNVEPAESLVVSNSEEIQMPSEKDSEKQ